MASTKTYVIYILFILFFNFLMGIMSIDSTGEGKAKDLLDTNNIHAVSLRNSIINNIDESDTANWFAKTLKGAVNITFFPFIVVGYLGWTISLIVYSFTTVPTLFQTLILAPLGLMIMFDYVLPMIRGN